HTPSSLQPPRRATPRSFTRAARPSPCVEIRGGGQNVTYANLSDVSTRLGRPITDANEIAQVNACLADVEALILARIPDLADRVAAATPSTAGVARAEANAAIRRLRNPAGTAPA